MPYAARGLAHILDAVDEQQSLNAMKTAPKKGSPEWLDSALLDRRAFVRWLHTLPGVRVTKRHDPLMISITTRERFDLYTENDVVRQGAAERGWFVLHESGSSMVLQSRACRERPVPSHLWHATEASNVDRILEEGLLPQRGGEGFRQPLQYPPRVYFVTRSPSQIHGMRLMLDDPHVFEVDTSKVPGLRLCDDPETTKQAAAYTEQTVPSSALQHLGTLEQAEAARPRT